PVRHVRACPSENRRSGLYPLPPSNSEGIMGPRCPRRAKSSMRPSLWKNKAWRCTDASRRSLRANRACRLSGSRWRVTKRDTSAHCLKYDFKERLVDRQNLLDKLALELREDLVHLS